MYRYKLQYFYLKGNSNGRVGLSENGRQIASFQMSGALLSVNVMMISTQFYITKKGYPCG
jgi:hypothetical protein